MADRDSTTAIVGMTQYEPEFRPTLICEAGHRTTTEGWRDVIQRGDLLCQVPCWAGTTDHVVTDGTQLAELEKQGVVGRCGAEYEDVQLFIDDVGRLLHLASVALASGSSTEVRP